MTTKLLVRLEQQDQDELAARHNGERRRHSGWVIDRLRNSLPPDHRALANRILDLQAAAEGIAPSGHEPIDGGGNSREVSMHYRCDAQRKLNGYDAAVRKRLGANGSRCFWAIAWGHTWADTMTACGYARGSHAMVKKLVQLTMMAAQDYADECALDGQREQQQKKASSDLRARG